VSHFDLGNTKERVSVELNVTLRMSSIKRKRVWRLQISTSWCVFKVRLHGGLWKLAFVADSSAKVGDLIHIEPEAVKGKEIPHAAQVILPPLDSSWVEKVRECCIIRPDLSNESFTVKL
jgi:hypothetical protein